LTQIESGAFYKSSLQSILIPRNVEILGSQCFSFCMSLSSITFESNSLLTQIESEAFSSSSLQSILMSSNVQLLRSNSGEESLSTTKVCESMSTASDAINNIVEGIKMD
jgi:hypothetical protein